MTSWSCKRTEASCDLQQMTGIGTLQSGPAGGMIATAFVAQLLKHPNVITADMGGTSFDVGLLSEYQFSHAREPIAERFRLLQPMIDVESIGAGGGTIARIDPVTGRLLVGPDSAGADPGPICYGMGGTQVTVTDANVVLGYIDPDYFPGRTTPARQRRSRRSHLTAHCKPLNLSLEQAAGGIYDVINSKMSDLIRRQVVRAGHVPEEYVVYAFGGAGPVHAAAYGAELGIDCVYIFPMSPVFSAFGVAASDVVHTKMVTRHLSAPINVETLYAELQSIEAALGRTMRGEDSRPTRSLFGARCICATRARSMKWAFRFPAARCRCPIAPRLSRPLTPSTKKCTGRGPDTPRLESKSSQLPLTPSAPQSSRSSVRSTSLVPTVLPPGKGNAAPGSLVQTPVIWMHQSTITQNSAPVTLLKGRPSSKPYSQLWLYLRHTTPKSTTISMLSCAARMSRDPAKKGAGMGDKYRSDHDVALLYLHWGIA